MRTCLHTSYTLLSEKFSSLKNVLIWQIWGMSASLETNLNHLCCDSRLPCYVFCTLTNKYKLKQKSTFHLLTRQQMQGWEKISLKPGHFGISPARNYCRKLKSKERQKDNFFTAIFRKMLHFSLYEMWNNPTCGNLWRRNRVGGGGGGVNPFLCIPLRSMHVPHLSLAGSPTTTCRKKTKFFTPSLPFLTPSPITSKCHLVPNSFQDKKTGVLVSGQ